MATRNDNMEHMRLLRRIALRAALALTALMVCGEIAPAQVDGPLISLRRGMLWNSYYYGKEAAPFSNWSRLNYGLDWPGFDPEWIGANIGGANSYMTSGGMWVGAKDDSGKIIAIEDWAMYAGTVTVENSAKYKVKKHMRRWKNGENFWNQADPAEAQDVIDTEWEMNPSYVPTYVGDRQLPLNVKRTVRQNAGSKDDENYITTEYVLRNVSDTLAIKEMYLMITYALGANSRGWNTLFANFNQGPRNNRFVYNPSEKSIVGYAEDYPETPSVNEKYDYYPVGGPTGKGEFLAPGYVGFRLLYSSPDSTGTATRVSNYAWSAVPDQQDLYGPFGSASMGTEARYEVIKDPMKATEAFKSPTDTRMTRRRVWSMMTLGPFRLKKGDSVRVVVGEYVAGGPYAVAVNPTSTAGVIGTEATKALTAIGKRIKIAADNKFRVPRPPASPEFTLQLGADPKQVSNILKWKTDVEALPDPDYTGSERFDLAGYRIYRSGYLPLGPWMLVAEIKKGDGRYLTGGQYTYVDTSVAIGTSYYYAITSYDSAHAVWPVNPAAFPGGVPSQESSIYASLYAKSSLNQNLVVSPFKTTIPAAQDYSNILVVPNPFVLQSGSVMPSDKSYIQFINVPSPCTIRIYTMRGDLVKTIPHDDGSGIALWNQQTDYGQFVGSGVYIYHIESPGGKTKTGKLAIVR
ncbi:MAG: hypothetical protein ACM3Q4_15675 [Acidobacteriota bacterium]